MSEPTIPGNDFGATEPPLVPPTYGGPSMPDITDLVEGSRGRTAPTSGGSGLGRNVIIGGVVGALVIAGGAFFAGRATAAGPATLADAVQQATAGTLPCGTPSGNGAGGFLARLCGSGTGAGTPVAGGAGGAGGGFAGGGFGRGLAGTVTAVTPTSVTVATRAGSVTVAVPSTAAVSKTVAGSMSDVTVGATVTIASTTDSSGNRTASRITLVPAGQLPGGPGGAGGPTA
jgi:hypothetical protein